MLVSGSAHLIVELTGSFIGVRLGVSKGVEDGHSLPALWVSTPETTIMLFQGWPPTGHRMVKHGGPYRYLRESMTTPCHTPMFCFPGQGRREPDDAGVGVPDGDRRATLAARRGRLRRRPRLFRHLEIHRPRQQVQACTVFLH
jgi:hypothetical protein